MDMIPREESVTIQINRPEDVLKATPEMVGETMSNRVVELIRCGYKWRKALGWKRSVSTVRAMRKAELLELVEGLIAHREISLCKIEMPGPMEPDEQVQKLAFLLEAYKRKVDALLPPGEVFVPGKDEP